MGKDPSYESPFNYAQPPYNQVNVAMAIGQDWAMLTEDPNLFAAKAAQAPNATAESNFNAGAVGMAIGQDWAGMAQNPFQVGNPDKMNVEQSFTQTDIGVGIGQDWAMMNGDGNLFDLGPEQMEAGFLEGVHRPYCGKYCKALGYARRADKFGFKQCVNECLINYKSIKSNRYKIKPAPDMDPNLDIPTDESKLPALTADETAIVDSTGVPAKSNTGMYVLITVVVLLIIAAIIFFVRRNRTGK